MSTFLDDFDEFCLTFRVVRVITITKEQEDFAVPNNKILIESLQAMLLQMRGAVAILDQLIATYTDEAGESERAIIGASLYKNYAFFKGKKPISVVFPNGREVEAGSWKKCVREILLDSITEPEVLQAMLSLRGRIFGKSLIILADSPERMDSPIHFGEELFFESKFDTESLLHMLVDRVLQPCGYDVRGIILQVHL